MTDTDTAPGVPHHGGSAGRGGLVPALGWALYLGVSWTWCIGMFLPVLLLRDYGVWGFVVFAVPNVVGAAAMGWTLRDASVSRRFVERNREAVYLFGMITIAFHAFWLTWLATWILGATGQTFTGAIPAIVGALVVAGVLSKDDSARARVVAGVVWLGSIALLAASLLTWNDGVMQPLSTEFFPTSDDQMNKLIGLAPVCLFGFALCPYLDATFHRARQGTSRNGGRLAFTLGFGVVFASMIALTLVYAGPLVEVFNGPDGPPIIWMPWAAIALMVHFAVQLVFTVRVHQHAANEIEPEISPKLAGPGRSLPLIGAVLAILTLFVVGPFFGMPSGELGYRCFIAAYGLVLPAYVWVCGIPTRDGHSGIHGPRGKLKLRLLIAAVVIATPMYFVGYILLTEFWLLPGLAVLLLARVPAMLSSRKTEE
ncbi:MAG: hypothetical protein ACI89L_001540 [Phycisphaerales bacterium]|jgi:hypothetical protein